MSSLTLADPFALKSRAKWHPVRAAYTAYARGQEIAARARFGEYALPLTVPGTGRELPDTAVTSLQVDCLLKALAATEHLSGTAVVEIGAYRGATSKLLAAKTTRPFIAVDPFIGYGGWETDMAALHAATRDLANVKHLRQTSGQAAREWAGPSISFVFIDAVHDYVNTRHDLEAWAALMVPGGLIAAHDTDNLQFAGTRRAVYEASKRFGVYLHAHDLTILGPVT
jgi:predicted O-methyltransferase YrrM